MKLVSVLVPTRKRVPSLHRCIESVIIKSHFLERVEICVAADDDDTDTIGYLIDNETRIRKTGIRFTSIVRKRPTGGYNGLWMHYTELYQASEGQYLVIFNDDAVVYNNGWDSALQIHHRTHGEVPAVIKPAYHLYEDAKPSLSMIGTKHNVGDADNVFPIVSRKVPEITGNFGMHSSLDVWFRLLGEYANITVNEPDVVFMHIGGEDSQHWIDQMEQYNPGGSYLMDSTIRSDAEKIKQYLASKI